MPRYRHIPLAPNRNVRYGLPIDIGRQVRGGADRRLRGLGVVVVVVVANSEEVFTPRQQQVLTAALDLLVEQGDRLTMTSVARRASCSKGGRPPRAAS